MARVVSKRDAERTLKKLGFDISKSGRHVRGMLRYNGKKVVATGFPQGRGDLKGGMSEAFRKQLKLDRSQFDDAVDCPLKAVGYLDILDGQGLL